jgi:hypothetical protein
MNVSRRRVLLNVPSSLLITMSTLYTVSFLLLISGRQSHQFFDQGSTISPDSERQTSENWWNVINEQLEENGKRFHLISLIKRIFIALESSSFPTAVAKNINQKCKEDSQLYVRSLYSNRTLWALQSKLKQYRE